MRMTLLFLFLAVLTTAPTAVSAQDLRPGTIADTVVCRGDARQSYALYLPSTYSRGKKWPILYAFDPAARGRVPVERFRHAAERFGFIVVGSNNSRNGPMGPVQEALDAMLADTRVRFPLDPRRTYFAGFSGGARIAVLVGTVMKPEVAGVIGFGAGLHEAVKPAASLPFAYFAAIGTDDFNYPEMRELDRARAGSATAHRLEVFEGRHDWPPEPVCAHALEFMELQAMKSGTRALDAALVGDMFAQASAEATAAERAGQSYQAFSRYAAMSEDFAGLHDIGQCTQKARQLERTPAVRQALRDLDDSVDMQQRLTVKVVKLSNAATSDEENGVSAYQDLIGALSDVKKQADKPRPSAARMAARRVLGWLWMELNQATDRDLARGDYRRAVVRLRVMAEMRPENSAVEYDLASAYARMGDRKRAVEALQRAVSKGFSDAAKLENDPDLAPLRGESRFQAIVSAMKK